MWTLEKIKEGFDLFIKDSGRLPTALEIDKADYLPSSRQIQRRFGGLEKLRDILGYEDTHFGKGIYRSNIANTVNQRGREAEMQLERILHERFGKVFVHSEETYGSSKNRIDFLVYAQDEIFGVDIFNTNEKHNLQVNINAKLIKYSDFPHKLFLVVANPFFEQEDIDKYMKDKRRIIPHNVSILSLKKLIVIIRHMKPYPNPLP